MRFFVALWSCLTPGQRIAQAIHAAVEFALDHPEAARAWRAATNTVVSVALDDEGLDRLLFDLEGRAHTTFREPDLGDRLTAVAVTSTGDAVPRVVRRAPLA